VEKLYEENRKSSENTLWRELLKIPTGNFTRNSIETACIDVRREVRK